jgi:hypothetical protein
MGYAYDNPIQVSYRFPAVTVSTAAVLGRMAGPSGRAGRVLSIAAVVTTDVTVAPALLTVDTNAGLTNPPSLSLPVGAANSIAGSTQADTEGADELPADTVIELQSDGGATAGAADVTVTIGWF